ncbi:hypothetical protein B1H18_07350 [Streptomyces tsukubensis]|uniref:Uncharacterized protein n=1 Tax=Streptomyces tsukubensis TaxID=83656 RepID=A0A1V4ACR3_9ACTN|nr:hypothetical protein B1H18_07350 [Streptomyces tsukubensis]
MGGGWIRENLQSALRTRHERKLELQHAAERRQVAVEAANKPPDPVCGCTHHLAKHDKLGKCHETVKAPVEWSGDDAPVRYEPRQCNCQQYIGPEPLATVFATELIDPSVNRLTKLPHTPRRSRDDSP